MRVGREGERQRERRRGGRACTCLCVSLRVWCVVCGLYGQRRVPGGRCVGDVLALGQRRTEMTAKGRHERRKGQERKEMRGKVRVWW